MAKRRGRRVVHHSTRRRQVRAEVVCAHCGTQYPAHEECPACQARKDAEDDGYVHPSDWRTAPAMSEAEMDEAGIRPNHSSPDRVCPYCGTTWAPNARECTACGYIFSPPAPSAAPVSRPHTPTQRVSPGPASWFSMWLVLIIVVGFLSILGGVWALWPREKQVLIQELRWKRTLVIEEYQRNQYEDWEDRVPHDADVVNSRRRLYDYEYPIVGYTEDTETTSVGGFGSVSCPAGWDEASKTTEFRETGEEECDAPVLVGTEKGECFDDGTCDVIEEYEQTCWAVEDEYTTLSCEQVIEIPVTKEVPVYEQWVTYTVDEWKQVDTLSVTGTGHEMHWPAHTADKTVFIGAQRNTQRPTQCFVEFIFEDGDEEAQSQKVSCSQYDRMAQAQVWTAKVSGKRVVEWIAKEK